MSAVESTALHPAVEVTPSPWRRFVERFALLAFAFYHVPLFVNAYPSLGGGGGGSETDLAVRWGHVFAPLGAWVAQHVLGLGPSGPDALSGDNGDVGEEYGRLLAGLLLALVL